jgi:hypothetical protein
MYGASGSLDNVYIILYPIRIMSRTEEGSRDLQQEPLPALPWGPAGAPTEQQMGTYMLGRDKHKRRETRGDKRKRRKTPTSWQEMPER